MGAWQSMVADCLAPPKDAHAEQMAVVAEVERERQAAASLVASRTASATEHDARLRALVSRHEAAARNMARPLCRADRAEMHSLQRRRDDLLEKAQCARDVAFALEQELELASDSGLARRAAAALNASNRTMGQPADRMSLLRDALDKSRARLRECARVPLHSDDDDDDMDEADKEAGDWQHTVSSLFPDSPAHAPHLAPLVSSAARAAASRGAPHAPPRAAEVVQFH